MFSHAYIGPFMTLVRYAHFHVFDRVVCRVRDRVSSRFEAESQKIDSDGGGGGGEGRREERNRTYGTVDTVTKRGEATRERTNERTVNGTCALDRYVCSFRDAKRANRQTGENKE